MEEAKPALYEVLARSYRQDPAARVRAAMRAMTDAAPPSA